MIQFQETNCFNPAYEDHKGIQKIENIVNLPYKSIQANPQNYIINSQPYITEIKFAVT